VSVLVVNDASTEEMPKTQLSFKKIKSVQVMNMKQNRGHARCYATGLKYLSEKENFDYVIQMDGDGEDRPEELSALFNKSKENPSKTVTLNRTKRSEGPLFKLLYECHKILTYIFTGKLIKFGNYSCSPRENVAKLVKEACIWSSFSGSVTKIISDRVSVPSIRGRRYFGPSQMNLFNLLIHSFSIIAVFKFSVILRTAIFSVFIYVFRYQIGFLPFILIMLLLIIFNILILLISFRENISELNNSLENINNIDVLSELNDR
jgi:glycosyltransferase involved in cell wall biosynthesis